MSYLAISVMLTLFCGPASGLVAAGVCRSSPPKVEPDAILAIEVFVRPKSGRQPAAKAKFYLLDAELETILGDAGLAPIVPWDNFVDTYTMAVGHSSRDKQLYRAFQQTAETAIKPHIVATIVTDANGKGQFNPVKPGKYYLFGVALTSKGVSAVRSEVDLVSGPNTFRELRETARLACAKNWNGGVALGGARYRRSLVKKSEPGAVATGFFNPPE